MADSTSSSSSDRRADLVWSLIWIVVGAAICYGGWTMDRLEKLNINPYTAPGLVPAALGVGIALLGVMLLVRSVRAARPPSSPSSYSSHGSEPTQLEAVPTYSTRRLILALVLCLAYGTGLVGRGLPFWLATFLFVFVAIVALQWNERRERGEVLRGVLIAAACATGTAISVTLVFQELFLVRLP